MPDGAPALVQEQETGEWGLRYPDQTAIEIYDEDGERNLVDPTHPDEDWQEADPADLQDSLDTDIEEVREEIAALRGSGLTDAQARQLDRLESRLDAQANTLKLVQEVENGDG